MNLHVGEATDHDHPAGHHCVHRLFAGDVVAVAAGSTARNLDPTGRRVAVRAQLARDRIPERVPLAVGAHTAIPEATVSPVATGWRETLRADGALEVHVRQDRDLAGLDVTGRSPDTDDLLGHGRIRVALLGRLVIRESLRAGNARSRVLVEHEGRGAVRLRVAGDRVDDRQRQVGCACRRGSESSQTHDHHHQDGGRNLLVMFHFSTSLGWFAGPARPEHVFGHRPRGE